MCSLTDVGTTEKESFEMWLGTGVAKPHWYCGEARARYPVLAPRICYHLCVLLI